MILRNTIILFAAGLFAAGCISTARISQLPTSANALDFEALAKQRPYAGSSEQLTHKFRDGYEYFASANPSSHRAMARLAIRALESLKYKDIQVDSSNSMIIAKRGLKANEWKTVSGIYYQLNRDTTRIYVRSFVTQDITGGTDINRAERIIKKMWETTAGE